MPESRTQRFDYFGKNLIRLHFFVLFSFSVMGCGPQQSNMQTFVSDSEHTNVESQHSDVGGLDIGDMASVNLNDMRPDLQVWSFQEIQDRVFTP